MLQTNDRCEDEILRSGIFVRRSHRARSLMPSVARISLVLLQHVPVRFFTAPLFRWLNGNLLEEHKHVREETAFEFGLLRRQLRQ